MINRFSFGLALAAASLATPALADIDLTTGSFGNAIPFGSPDTATYGQTFVASAGATELTSFSLFLDSRYSGGGSLDLRGYLGTWDGNKLVSLLYTSPTVTMNSAGSFQQFLFTPGAPIAVTAGEQYVAFLSISGLPEQAESLFGMPIVTDTIAGNWVYSNNGTDFGALTTANWTNVASFDAYITVDFNGAVPEPDSWALLIAGFGLTGAVLRRRRAITA